MTVREVVSAVRWYLREVSGESAYDRYVAHMRCDHPAQPVMSRRDFERRRQDQREASPGALLLIQLAVTSRAKTSKAST